MKVEEDFDFFSFCNFLEGFDFWSKFALIFLKFFPL
jgi:hypothetical protein